MNLANPVGFFFLQAKALMSRIFLETFRWGTLLSRFWTVSGGQPRRSKIKKVHFFFFLFLVAKRYIYFFSFPAFFFTVLGCRQTKGLNVVVRKSSSHLVIVFNLCWSGGIPSLSWMVNFNASAKPIFARTS